jgi:succinate dehydrogenase / fumarate reductase membrane anchor subunit
MVLFVLGPSFLHGQQELGLNETDAAIRTWHIGICSIFLSGIFKVACAFVSGVVHRAVPRAGLLGSLTAIALVPLFLWFVASLAAVATADYATAVAWIQSPWNSALLILLIGSLFYHAQLGMQVVFEDYISTHWLQVACIILVRFLALLLAAVSIIAVLRTAWGS